MTRPSYAVNGQGFQRVVGYYESWSPDRPCNQFFPEQIPKFIYTHLNFAFATIDPISFEVKLAAPTDEDLVRRLTGLKAADPGLSVFVALGGWTFNDPGPTATTFGDIARSEANTKKFINSLISFMSTYNFDGVDLDVKGPLLYPSGPRAELIVGGCALLTLLPHQFLREIVLTITFSGSIRKPMIGAVSPMIMQIYLHFFKE